ncbi:MAG: neutral/alkaline non-lysosomal ceramidase N-terminal domain-containing protein [Pirellulaceae bacterium]|jgi:hypothetical protein|nr:neutral/alkaline non-lysosomal ceramidase N-terminal domain-containing protein [Pirellulaceae bacterium]HJN07445.1 neutral/alkaline non-lysosomal ceramidase N-terminal domain-containing protein [Pirellulaceae bacterium]
MKKLNESLLGRREFFGRAIGAGAATALTLHTRSSRATATPSLLEVGEGAVDTTPPLGIEMAGFHRPADNRRLITGVRQPTAVRALVLRHPDAQAAIVSLDICGVSRDFVGRVQRRVAKQTGIPSENVHVCATHTHSMPTFRFFRQWGAIPRQYMADIELSIVQAIERARDDLAPAELYVGKSGSEGANFNRTANTWKTDKEFTPDSADDERWLDTKVHVMRFERAGAKRNLLWYHFSAHPVCYTDGNAGPDWPGLVAKIVLEKQKIAPVFLQGHCGDVNPGNGKPWLGKPDEVAAEVSAAIGRAFDDAVAVPIKSIRHVTAQCQLSLDLQRFKHQLDQYRKSPSTCTKGEWVDAGFAADWFQSANRWDLSRGKLNAPISALRLGGAVMLFHPSELYSYYGLALGRDSPLDHTLVVGYSDAFVGYLPDPNAYKAGEYAAITVPRICDLPPFKPETAREFTAAASRLLEKVAS